MLIMSLGCLRFSREPCLLYTFLLGYLPSIFCDFGEKPIDFYLQDSFVCFIDLWYYKAYRQLRQKAITTPNKLSPKILLITDKTVPPSLTVPLVI